MADWMVPGYDAESGLSVGGDGEVWCARERSTGDAVRVRVLHGDCAEDVDRLRREAVTLAGVRHSHLLRLRTVLPVDGGVALVSDVAAGGSLPELLADRPALAPGEVVTIGVALAAALTALHRRGLTHGEVTADDVVFTAEGRPLLVDYGVRGLTGLSGSSAAEDVRALAALLQSAIGGSGPPALHAALVAAQAQDAAARPSAADLAVSLRSSVPTPVPVRLVHATQTGPTVVGPSRGGPDLAASGPSGSDWSPLPRATASGAAQGLTGSPGSPGSAASASRRLLDAPKVRLEEVAPPGGSTGSTAGSVPESGLSRLRSSTRTGGSSGAARGARTRARPPLALVVAVPLALIAAVLLGRAWAAAERTDRPAELRPAALPTGAGTGLPGSTASTAARGTAARGTAAPAPVPTAGARAAPAGSELRTPTTREQLTPATGEQPTDWLAVIRTLDDRRNAALTNLDGAGLAAVYAAGSPALEAESAVIRQLAGASARPDGLRLDVESATLVRRTPAGVTVRVVDRLPAYLIIGSGDRVLERRPARGGATWQVDLVPGGDGWRIVTVRPG